MGLSAPAIGLIAAMGAGVFFVAWLYLLLVRGRLTLDLGWGRRLYPLGPIAVQVKAPRDVVFEQISGAYLGRTPRRTRDELQVLERSDRMVLAAHHTRLRGLTVTTVETVRFEPPDRIDFRHVRGPVPHVTEHFELREVGDGTEIGYGGELGIDLWGLGALWSRRVVRIWNRVVQASLEQVKAGAEARAAAHERRA